MACTSSWTCASATPTAGTICLLSTTSARSNAPREGPGPLHDLRRRPQGAFLTRLLAENHRRAAAIALTPPSAKKPTKCDHRKASSDDDVLFTDQEWSPHPSNRRDVWSQYVRVGNLLAQRTLRTPLSAHENAHRASSLSDTEPAYCPYLTQPDEPLPLQTVSEATCQARTRRRSSHHGLSPSPCRHQ